MMFTPQELSEMAAADAEIERDFCLTEEEAAAADTRDIEFSSPETRKAVERKKKQREYYIENRKKKLEYGRNYYAENRTYILWKKRVKRNEQLRALYGGRKARVINLLEPIMKER